MTDMRWEDPPTPHTHKSGRHGDLAAKASELQANPGRWAWMGEYSTNSGGLKAFMRKRYNLEVTQRTVTAEDGTKRYAVYARWPGQS